MYQAVLFHDGWRGIADFLERVDTPSELGPWSYEVGDTKLARHSKPTHSVDCSSSSSAEQEKALAEPTRIIEASS